MKKPVVSFRINALLARKTWGEISKTAMRALRELTSKYSISVASGDLQFFSPHQMLGSRSKYSSSSFLPPSPLPSTFSDSMNSIRSIHLTIL